MYPNSN
jgi:hypothetical protein